MGLLTRLIRGRTDRFTDVTTYKDFFMLNLLAIGCIVLYACFGVYYQLVLHSALLLWVHIGAALVALVAFGINRRGGNAAVPMTLLTLALAVLCVFWAWELGWESGAIWLILAAVIPYFLIAGVPRALRVTLTLLCFVLFNVSIYICFFTTPQLTMGRSYAYTAIVSSGVFIIIAFEACLSFLANTYGERVYVHTKEEEEARSWRDPLTDLWNPRYIEQMSTNGGAQGAVAAIDIDNFRDVNDTRGHEVGDRLIVHLTQLMRQNFRRTDTLVRWGGEEFLLIFYDVPFPRAIELIDNFRHMASMTPLTLADKTEIPFTFSGGLCALPEGASIPDTIARAEEHLRRAKQEGRNRIVADEVPHD